MRRLLCGLLLPLLLACGKEKGAAPAKGAGAPAEDWSGITWDEKTPMPDEFKPALRAAFKGLNAGEKPLGFVGPFGGSKAPGRFILVAMNAPQDDNRVVRFFVLNSGADNSAPPAYETGIPYSEGIFKVLSVGNRDRDSLPDIEYCRFSGVPPVGAVFVAGFRYDAWYRIDEPSGRPCTPD